MPKQYSSMTLEEKTKFNLYCAERWRQRKLDAIQYKGGKCERCGYNKYPDVLEFHHIDSTQKEANWSKMRLWSWNKVLIELDKCMMVCANCHREIHVELRKTLNSK